MLQLIQQHVQKSIERSMPPGEERTELQEAHDLVIHGEPEMFNGASSHEEYLRPPQMIDYFCDETRQPGCWRN
ncbi:hypothetical protein N7453_004364 [Penicillium expansum]|nr:hypothetical protein N7453_004364 [Penicillium expansum]